MTVAGKLTEGDVKAIARNLFDSSDGVLYLTKKTFETIAIETDPENAPPITGWGREEYIGEILTAFPVDSSAMFVANTIKAFQRKLQNAIENHMVFDKDASYWRKSIRATSSRVNRILGKFGMRVSAEGLLTSEAPYEGLDTVRRNVYDGLGRWELHDVRLLLENAESHLVEGRAVPLRYNDCASNAAKALEGILRKALVEAHIAKGHSDPSGKIKTMMGRAIQELDELGFWPDDAVKNAVDNYREFLRNRAQHYDTVDMNIRLSGFNRPTAFFALWEAIALIGTIIETLDEL